MSRETQRLLLSPWSDEYADDFASVCADPVGMYFISGGHPIPREVVDRILEHTTALWRSRGHGQWAAVEKASGKFVGRIGLNLLADWPGPDKWEIAFELAREFWGRGYATEGAREAVAFGFERGLERIIGVTRPDHAAARRVLEKCGLTCQNELEWRGTSAVWYSIDRPPE